MSNNPNPYEAFVAEYYDYLPVTAGRRDIEFYLHWAAQQGDPILELGCGTGRVTRPLARGERRGRHIRDHCFELVFRTLSVPQMTRQLERAGFEAEAVLGGYRGRPWDDRADVWIILARRRVNS